MKRLIVILAMFAMFISACAPEMDAPPPKYTAQQMHITIWHDDTNGVTCWIWSGSQKGGIACLPDSQLR
jgi:hypothetical protein